MLVRTSEKQSKIPDQVNSTGIMTTHEEADGGFPISMPVAGPF